MIWFASDHHFGHAALLTFTKDDGSHARPGFSDVDHMNETMIANHNRVVGPTDRVYFLGDVGFSRATLAAVLPRLNGKKRLILGNHDYSDRQMMRFVEDAVAELPADLRDAVTLAAEQRDATNPKSRITNPELLVPQRVDGIEARRAAGRPEARGQRHDDEEQRDRDERDRIRWAGLHDQRFQQPVSRR